MDGQFVLIITAISTVASVVSGMVVAYIKRDTTAAEADRSRSESDRIQAKALADMMSSTSTTFREILTEMVVLTKANNAIREEVRERDGRIDELEAELVALREEGQAKEALIAGLQTQLDTFKTSLASKDASIGRLQKRVGDLEIARKADMKKIAALEQERDDLLAEAVNLRTQLAENGKKTGENNETIEETDADISVIDKI